MIKYTFLLPAYKAHFLKESLESIKKQTYKDFKVLVSDDCSPENLKAIYDEVCCEDTRFKYRRNDENMGGESLVSHWNLLVSMCDTEFLIIASDDDIYDSHFLEEIDKLQIKFPNVDLLRARVKNINEIGELRAEDAIYKEYVEHIGFIYQKHFNNALRCIANYVFRREPLVAKGGVIDFPLAWFSDDATVIMMAENGLANTKDILFGFRSTEESISSRKMNHNDAYKKALSTILYHRWFNNMIDCVFNQTDNDVLKLNYKKFILYNHNIFIHEQFSYMSSECTIKDFSKLLSLFPIYDRMRFFYRYIRNKMKS